MELSDLGGMLPVIDRSEGAEGMQEESPHASTPAASRDGRHCDDFGDRKLVVPLGPEGRTRRVYNVGLSAFVHRGVMGRATGQGRREEGVSTQSELGAVMSAHQPQVDSVLVSLSRRLPFFRG